MRYKAFKENKRLMDTCSDPLDPETQDQKDQSALCCCLSAGKPRRKGPATLFWEVCSQSASSMAFQPNRETWQESMGFHVICFICV